MKHYQLILAAALVALAACNKGKVENLNTASDNEIGFNAVARKATKANNAIVTDATYPTDNSFGVWAFNSPVGNWSEFNSSSASNFMTGIEIKQTTGRDTSRPVAWRNADTYYYWPFTGAIAFIACHPFEVVPTVNFGGAAIADYTISNSNKTTDLMFAYATGSRAANATTPVNLVFKHALSQVYFTIKTNDNYIPDNVQFKVKSVTFNNIDLSGDVTYNKSTISWNDNDTQTEDWVYYASAVEATYAGVAYGSAQVMIPQAANIKASALDPGDANYDADDVVQTTLTIEYYMKQNTTETEGTLVIPAPQTWAANGKYNYILNFKLNEILFNPSVNDWAELTVVEKNIFD